MAGRNKNKKSQTHSIELNNDEKNLKILFDEKGACKIMISNADFSIVFNVPEEQTHLIRLMFWDNYKRFHVWKTKTQKKAEKAKQVADLTSNSEITWPDLDLSVDNLIDVTTLGNKSN